MEHLSKKIMQYVDDAYKLEDKQRDILKFGIECSLEIGMNILVSTFILYAMNMIVEGIFFFSIFIPLRAYSGGYHANTYLRCLILSILSLTGVMLMSKRLHIATMVMFILISVLIFLIWIISPVINAERPVSYYEYQKFSRKLKITLIFIELLTGILVLFGIEKLINVLLSSLLLVVINLIIGKWKYKDYQMKK